MILHLKRNFTGSSDKLKKLCSVSLIKASQSSPEPRNKKLKVNHRNV